MDVHSYRALDTKRQVVQTKAHLQVSQYPSIPAATDVITPANPMQKKVTGRARINNQCCTT